VKRVEPTWPRYLSCILGALRRPARCRRSATSPKPDVPFQPTPQQAVEQMLVLAGVHSADVVYDLGSGDGRIVITAAQSHGARAVGIDIDRRRIERSLRRARKERVVHRVTFSNQDFFDADISEATVVALFLWPEVTLALQSKLLRELEPGTRVVSYFWEIADWVPDAEIAVDGRPIYLWTMPPRLTSAAPSPFDGC
jgi:hypothetical protein